MTTDDRLLFIALRKREMDLARAMVEDPDDLDLWNEWHSAAMQADELYVDADQEEQEILDDLTKVLRLVYSGAFGFEQLLTPR